MMSLVRLGGAVAAAALLALPAQAQSLKPWRQAMIMPKADAGFFLMAAKRGFAEREGLKGSIVIDSRSHSVSAPSTKRAAASTATSSPPRHDARSQRATASKLCGRHDRDPTPWNDVKLCSTRPAARERSPSSMETRAAISSRWQLHDESLASRAARRPASHCRRDSASSPSSREMPAR